MEFVVEKDEGPIPYVLMQILDTCATGITISDPEIEDNPIVYANASFGSITGYEPADIVGRNCRFLQGEEREQPELDEIRAAISEARGTTVILRNYTRAGDLFHNQLTVQPLFDRGGHLVYFLGIQHDVTEQIQTEQELERLRRLLGASAG